MLRFATLAAALSILTTGVALADELPAADARVRPPAPATEPVRAPDDAGAALGARLAALGQLRPLGDDFDLAVRGVFDDSGAASFGRWRTLADTLGDAAQSLPFHRIVVVARAPRREARAADVAQIRAFALRDALLARGVTADRIETVVAPRDPGGIELQIRFEQTLAPATAGR